MGGRHKVYKDEKTRLWAQKLSEIKRKLFAEGKLVPHNKGKTKDNYAPLRKVSEQVSGSGNGMYLSHSWNKGLTKEDNPDQITYGCVGEKHWNWKGGVDRHQLRKPEWQSIRRRIRKRDKHTCQLCHNPGKGVHHKVPWRISHDNSDSNLVTLCETCHGLCDRMYDHHKLMFEDIVRSAQKCAEEMGNPLPPASEFCRLLKQQLERACGDQQRHR